MIKHVCLRGAVPDWSRIEKRCTEFVEDHLKLRGLDGSRKRDGEAVPTLDMLAEVEEALRLSWSSGKSTIQPEKQARRIDDNRAK